MPAPSLPTCPCGHDRYHHWARADLRYGVGGWFNFINGISAQPREITFRCGRCGQVFEQTRDPGVMREFRRYPYVNRQR
ncbi:MAG: hypothetical protein ACK41D_01845 [Rubricoccaceae bacterium]